MLLMLTVRRQQSVDAVDDPAEETSVERLCHGVAHTDGLLDAVPLHDGLTASDDTTHRQSFHQIFCCDAE